MKKLAVLLFALIALFGFFSGCGNVPEDVFEDPEYDLPVSPDKPLVSPEDPPVILVPVPAPDAEEIQKTGALWFDCSQDVVKEGDAFETGVFVNAGVDDSIKLAAFAVEITFNSDVIDLDKSLYSDGIQGGADLGDLLLIPNSQNTGKLTFVGFSLNGVEPQELFNLVKIHWIALSVGEADVTINVSSLSDLYGNAIGEPFAIPVSLTVN